MANKAVFIGLGGAGVSPAGHLKAKLLFDAYDGDEDELKKDCRFVFIDTDGEAISALNREYQERLPDGRLLITAAERVDLGWVNPHAMYWAARGKPEDRRSEMERHLLSWVDEHGSRQFINQPLQHGAGANRQQGRLAVLAGFQQIRERIIAALNILQDIKEEAQYEAAYPTFFILSGTCGGTGSSAFLDVAYLLDREFKVKCPRFGDPIVRAVLFMPHWYIELYRAKGASERTVQDYYCNAYAFFQEINACLKDRWVEGDGTKFSRTTVVRERAYEGLKPDQKPWPLFNFAFCIDSRTEGGFTTNDEEMYRNTAELLYHWHRGSAKGKVISGIDNEKKEFPNTPSGSAVRAFYTIGYRALRFPEQLMRDYFHRRFLFEVFHHGLLGKDYHDALPDREARQQHLDATFKRTIARYLFPENQEEGVPNLRKSREEILNNYLPTLTLSRFNKQGTEKRDPDRIGDLLLLRELIQDARSIISAMEREMDQQFASPGLDTSRENLLRFIQQGYRVRPDEAPDGSLEIEIENAILRYGLNYAIELTDRLDTMCEERVNSPARPDDLTDLKEERQRRLVELEAEIDSARQKCLSEKKSREKLNALEELYDKLSEEIELAARLKILDQQTQVLNALSRGESGVLDGIERKLRELADRARRRVEGNQQQSGLREQYQADLRNRFLKTTEDVTTTYLPDVAAFVEGGRWKADHLFARLYKGLVKQEPLAGGGEEPLRYGRDYGRHPEKAGLHRLLWDLLTGAEYTGLERGYEEHGHTNFFRRFFGRDGSFEVNQIIALLESFAGNYIRLAMERSQEVQDELNKKLHDRYQALEDEKKNRVREKFDDRGTQTFCLMSRAVGEGPTAYNVYAGDDEALAGELGYSDRTHQFVQENVANRFLKIKVLTRQTLDLYPDYSICENVYHSTREERGREGSIFAPHIHTLFNQLGVEKGLKRACLTGEEGLLEMLSRLLLYREMFEQADSHLVTPLLSIDERLKGSEKTCRSPLLIEGAAAGSSRKVALVCGRIERVGQKLQLKRKDYLVVSSDVQSYKALYDGLSQSDYMQLSDALDEFDQHFQKTCAHPWLDVFEQASQSLQAKVAKGMESRSAGIKTFYEHLNNSLVPVSDRLKEKIAASGQRITGVETEKAEETEETESIPL